MAKVAFDLIEQILLGLDDVKDIIRCKIVCKSWQSLISTPRFVKAHLNHDRQNFGDRRICLTNIVSNDEYSFGCNFMYIVGSCNGLVCVAPTGAQLEVTNPWTREINKLQPLPCPHHRLPIMIRRAVLCLGFGYDATTDDYKVIAGLVKEERGMVFHVLTLKSNIWKAIREVKYMNLSPRSGILCGGALHWIMTSKEEKKNVIVSWDLSTEEFKEIPQPTDANNLYAHRLGVIEDSLCIFSNSTPMSGKKWVMKNNKWEQYNNKRTYEVAHCLSRHPVVDSQNTTSSFYTLDDGRLVPSGGDHIRASMIVKSLVSPHPHRGSWKRKRKVEEVF